jgi:GTP pyrophosphokinase
VLHSLNEPGGPAQIAQVIAHHDGSIENVSMSHRTEDFTQTTSASRGACWGRRRVELSVFDLKHLTAIMQSCARRRRSTGWSG